MLCDCFGFFGPGKPFSFSEDRYNAMVCNYQLSKCVNIVFDEMQQNIIDAGNSFVFPHQFKTHTVIQIE